VHDNGQTWALVPIKEFDRAKSRLGGTLTAAQCADLAVCMAGDVIDALRGSARIDHIACLGTGPHIAEFAARQGATFMAEQPGDGLSSHLDAAARQLAERGAQVLVIVPVDVPMITSVDVDALLAMHTGGLTICPARRDGGTNALVIEPPTGIAFRFGEHSAARHVEAAVAAGLDHRVVQAAAFEHDIDTPADLAALCRTERHTQTGRYLDRSGIRSSHRPPAAPVTA